MRHQGTKTIETARLILRPLTVNDAEEMFANWAHDPAVTRYLTWVAHTDVSATKALLTEWVQKYDTDPTYYNWGIVRKEDGVLMGTIGAIITDRSEHFEPGYCMGKAFWGRGYATEALDAMVRYLFDAVGMEVLSCCHAVQNPASGNVMQKIGFVHTKDASYEKMDGSEVFPCRFYELTKEQYDRTRNH